MIVDYRCPRCNGILAGTEEVVTTTNATSPVHVCKHCGIKVILTFVKDDLGTTYYFEEVHAPV